MAIVCKAGAMPACEEEIGINSINCKQWRANDSSSLKCLLQRDIICASGMPVVSLFRFFYFLPPPPQTKKRSRKSQINRKSYIERALVMASQRRRKNNSSFIKPHETGGAPIDN